MSQEGNDLRLRHVGWMPDVTEEDRPLEPVAVALFDLTLIVVGSENVAEAIEELGLAAGRRRGGGSDGPEKRIDEKR